MDLTSKTYHVSKTNIKCIVNKENITVEAAHSSKVKKKLQFNLSNILFRSCFRLRLILENVFDIT